MEIKLIEVLNSRGKYGYKEKNRIEAEIIIREQMKKYFPKNRIEYIV